MNSCNHAAWSNRDKKAIVCCFRQLTNEVGQFIRQKGDLGLMIIQLTSFDGILDLPSMWLTWFQTATKEQQKNQNTYKSCSRGSSRSVL